MRATDKLKDEHRAIEGMLDILERVCERIEAGEAVDREHPVRIVEFFRIFADRCHHGKEEGVLFPALEGVGVPREGGPIGVMLQEHDMGREFVRAMGEAISDERFDKAKFVGSARGYIDLLRQHIAKEDNILFRIAGTFLTEGTQKELLERFDEVERERIEPEKHEECLRTLSELKRIYPET